MLPITDFRKMLIVRWYRLLRLLWVGSQRRCFRGFRGGRWLGGSPPNHLPPL